MPFSKLIGPSIVFALSGTCTFLGYSFFNGNETFYSDFVMPTIHKLFDGEQAHNLAITFAKFGLVPFAKHYKNEDILRVKVFDRVFENPIGLAAGFDKNGEALNGLFKIGFGFVEIGTITPLPQEGNPKPRVFRLSEDHAIINRYGFNSEGHQPVIERVKSFKNDTANDNKILGINIGKNKTSTDAVKDYLKGVSAFEQFADYLVINISSPNTPGLRSLQSKKELENLIDPILELKNHLNKNLPVIVKIAPDLNEDELKDIAEVVMRKNKTIDGLIVSNTTITRPNSLKNKNKIETGGLSGQPLKKMSNKVTERMYELTNGKIAIIGVGGIRTGKDALEKIKCGASLIQIYTSMVYEGPTIVNKIKRELVYHLEKEGYKNVSEAVGINVKSKKNN